MRRVLGNADDRSSRSPRCVDFSAAAASTPRFSRSSSDHLEREIEAHRSRGVPPEEARRLALRDLGGLTQTIESTRDVRATWLDTCLARPEIRRAAVAALAALHGHRADRARPRHWLDDGDFLDRLCGAGAAVALSRRRAPGLPGRTAGRRHRVAELRRLAPARHVVRRPRELAGRRGHRHERPAPAAVRLAKRDRELLWRARRDASSGPSLRRVRCPARRRRDRRREPRILRCASSAARRPRSARRSR